MENIESEAIEVIPAKATQIVPQQLTNADVLALEEAAKNFERVMILAMKMTNASDWIDQGGKPYLQASGAEKIAVPFGLSYGPVNPAEPIRCEEREDKKGKYLIFTAHYFAARGERRVEFIGRASTRGDLFSRGQTLDFEEISIPNVMGQAQTNALGNCITRILGIRNLTWEQLGKYGIRQGDSKRVEYKKKSEGAAGSAQSKQQEQNPFWKTVWQGKNYIFAKSPPFEEKFVLALGMKAGKTPGVYNASSHIEEIEVELQKMVEFKKTNPDSPKEELPRP